MSEELAAEHSHSRAQHVAVRSILRNGARLMGINWLETALGAVYFAIIARYLGPDLYGRWAYGIASYILVIGIAGSFDILTLLHLGRSKQGAADFVGLTLTLRLACLGLGAIGLAFYALAADRDPLNSLVLLGMIPALIGRGTALWARTCFLAYERVADYVRFATLMRTAEAACGIAYLCAGGHLLGIVCLHSLSWLIEAGWGLSRIRSRLFRYVLGFQWDVARRLLAQGSVLGLATAGSAWLTAGPVMLLRYSGVEMGQLGQFALVLSLTMILVGSADAFFSAALPVLSRSERGVIGAGYGRIAALTIAAGACAAAGLGQLLGPAIMQHALGPQYAVAGSILAPFLLIGGSVLLPIGYFQSLLISGRRWPEAIAYICAGAFLAIGLVPASRAWGIQGAVLATGIAWSIRAAILIGWGEMNSARAVVAPRVEPAEQPF